MDNVLFLMSFSTIYSVNSVWEGIIIEHSHVKQAVNKLCSHGLLQVFSTSLEQAFINL